MTQNNTPAHPMTHSIPASIPAENATETLLPHPRAHAPAATLPQPMPSQSPNNHSPAANGVNGINLKPLFNFELCNNDEIGAITIQAFANRPALAGVVSVKAIKFETLEEDHAQYLLRARYYYSDQRKLKKGKHCFNEMLFKMPDGAFVRIDKTREHPRILVTAETREQVEYWLTHITTRYVKRTAALKPTFSVIGIDTDGPDTAEVNITRSFALPNDTIRLLYGDEFLTWTHTLMATMKAKDTGVFIFQGAPGTGKTSFIRHLVDKLKKTHRFYYLPVTNDELLTSPRMVDFWARENRVHDKQKKVIILEDAEHLLERDKHGRSGSVANLLNIADGILGELLKVQILCTVNCDLANLDEALIRPGRLLDCREFPRLQREQARRIADKYGKQLPDLPDYALSDIFGAKPAIALKSAEPKRLLGFAAGVKI